MGKRQNETGTRGTLKRVAPGLCRYSTSGVYFAHVRIGGKLFRESLETTDRKLADRKLNDFRRSKAKVALRAGKLTLKALAVRYDATIGHVAATVAPSLTSREACAHSTAALLAAGQNAGPGVSGYWNAERIQGRIRGLRAFEVMTANRSRSSKRRRPSAMHA